MKVGTLHEAEEAKHSSQQRDMAFYILTETSLADELRADYPNGNIIYREDYQKSFKKEVRWADTKVFLKKYAYFFEAINCGYEVGTGRSLS